MESEDPDAVIRDVGRRIAELRADLGLTQDKFAEALSVSGVYVRRVEIGQENLTLRSLTRFAATLGVRTADLLAVPQSREVRLGRPPRRSGASPEAAPDHAMVANPRSQQEAPGRVTTEPESPDHAASAEPQGDRDQPSRNKG